MEIDGKNAELENDVYRYGFTLLEVVPLNTAVLHITSSSTRKMRVNALSRVKLSLCKPLRECIEIRFEVTFDEKVWGCFRRVLMYNCNTSGDKEIFSTRHGAGKHHTCVTCLISLEKIGHGKKRPIRLLAATSETQKQVQSPEEIAGLVSARGRRQRCGQKMDEIVRLLSQPSLAKWPSFLEELSSVNRLCFRDGNSIH